MTRLKVRQLLERQPGVIKSIDVRTLAIREEAGWKNQITIIRFSPLDIKRISETQGELRKKAHTDAISDMRLFLDVLDIETLEALDYQLQASRLDLGGVSIRLPAGVDILELAQRFPCRWPVGGPNRIWPVLEGEPVSGTSWVSTHSMEEAAVQFGFPNMGVLVREVLEVIPSRAEGFGLLIQVPFCAAVTTWALEDEVLAVDIEAHRMLTDLELSAFVTTRTEKMAFSKSLDLSCRHWDVTEGEFVETKAEFATKGLRECVQAEPPPMFAGERRGTLNVKLVLTDKREPPMNAYIVEETLEQQEGPNMAGLLSRVLALFCPEEDLLDQLLQSGEVERKPPTQPQCVFERAVSWLLAMCGFSTVVLEEYENLYNRKTGVQLETLDGLAWFPERAILLLVECTLGRPTANRVDSLKEVRRIMETEMPELAEVDVRPVMFCCKEELSSGSEDAANQGIVVVGKEEIRQLWDLAKRGDLEGILSILSMPESI